MLYKCQNRPKILATVWSWILVSILYLIIKNLKCLENFKIGKIVKKLEKQSGKFRKDLGILEKSRKIEHHERKLRKIWGNSWILKRYENLRKWGKIGKLWEDFGKIEENWGKLRNKNPGKNHEILKKIKKNYKKSLQIEENQRKFGKWRCLQSS